MIVEVFGGSPTDRILVASLKRPMGVLLPSTEFDSHSLRPPTVTSRRPKVESKDLGEVISEGGPDGRILCVLLGALSTSAGSTPTPSGYLFCGTHRSKLQADRDVHRNDDLCKKEGSDFIMNAIAFATRR